MCQRLKFLLYIYTLALRTVDVLVLRTKEWIVMKDIYKRIRFDEIRDSWLEIV